jgi:Zn-dependent protease
MARGFSEGGGSLRLFRVFGIDVFLHWSWLLVALFEIQSRSGKYNSQVWNVLEYVTLFAIVLLHEFGHALACRSVGGKADRIVLWPLGGVAFVQPPNRAGAVLWSIVAGPLVNVILAPLLYFLPDLIANSGGSIDAVEYASSIFWINLLLLIFNCLPIYPLDGGKILWSLLWFLVGRGKALRVASIIGLVGTAGVIALALYAGNMWFLVLAAFAVMQSIQGIKSSRAMEQMDAIPRNPIARCPSCGEHPPMAPLWGCGRCGQQFDTFQTGAMCPRCGAQFETTTCFSCGEATPIGLWYVAPPPPQQAAPTAWATLPPAPQ